MLTAKHRNIIIFLFLLLCLSLVAPQLIQASWRTRVLFSVLNQPNVEQLSSLQPPPNNDSEPLQIPNRFFGENRLLRSLAIQAWLAGNRAEAIDFMVSYATVVPDDQTQAWFLGSWNFATGEYDAAFENWSTIDSGNLLISRATMLIDNGDLSLAEKTLSLSQQTKNLSYGFNYRLATQYSRLIKQYLSQNNESAIIDACDDASSAFESALDQEPSLGFVYINYAVLLRDCGRFADAIQQLQQIDASFPQGNQAWAKHEIALTYMQQSKPEDAISYLEAAIALAPEQTTYYPTLIKAYEEVLAETPDRHEFRIRLGKHLANLGYLQEAAAQYQIVLENQNTHWQTQAQQALNELNANQ